MYIFWKLWPPASRFPNCICPSCIFPNCIFQTVFSKLYFTKLHYYKLYVSKCTQLAHLLSFASLFQAFPRLPVPVNNQKSLLVLLQGGEKTELPKNDLLFKIVLSGITWPPPPWSLSCKPVQGPEKQTLFCDPTFRYYLLNKQSQ